MQPTAAGTASPEPEGKIAIHFEDGIYGFEDIKDFVLVERDSSRVIWSLCAGGGGFPSLIVVDPFVVMQDYRPQLTPQERQALGDPSDDELCFFAVAVIRENLADSVVNLKSPIVINMPARRAKQIIMENSDYPVRYRLFGGAPKRR